MEIKNEQEQMPWIYDSEGNYLGRQGKEHDHTYISMPGSVDSDGTVNTNVFRVDNGNIDDWEAAYQQQMFDLSMAMFQNQWNTPANQVKLLKEAGLNPSVFNGSSNSTAAFTNSQQANNSVAAGQLEMQEQQMLIDNLLSTGEFMTGSLESAYDMRIQQQQMDNEYERLKLEGEQLDLDRQRVNNETRQTDSNVKKTDSETRNIQKEYEVLESSIAESKSRKDLTDKQREQIDKDFVERVRLDDATISRIAKENELSDSQISHISSQIDSLLVDNRLKESQISLNDANFYLVKDQDYGIRIKNALDDKYGNRERQLQLENCIYSIISAKYSNLNDVDKGMHNFDSRTRAAQDFRDHLDRSPVSDSNTFRGGFSSRNFFPLSSYPRSSSFNYNPLDGGFRRRSWIGVSGK